jgi:hypothetical protein
MLVPMAARPGRVTLQLHLDLDLDLDLGLAEVLDTCMQSLG